MAKLNLSISEAETLYKKKNEVLAGHLHLLGSICTYLYQSNDQRESE